MNEKPHEPQIPEDAAITSPRMASARLLGSHPATMLRLRIQKNGDGPGPEPGPKPPPPVPVSTPDIAFQFSPCLPDNLRDPVISAVRAAIDPNADVRAICFQGTERIGIWLRPSLSSADSQARDRGMERISVLAAGETFAVFINSALIRSRGLDAWNNAPKRLNGDGQPDAGGPIHLTGFSISFESPSRVVTQIDGFDERPWPDVDFHLITTDTLSVSADQVQCQSEAKLDADTSWLNFLTGLFGFLTVVVSGWFALPAAIFLVERIIVGSVDAPDVNAGAGCGAAGLIPHEILIPGGFKVVLLYRRVEVGPGGIFAGGTYLPIPRSPVVTIVGQTQIAVVEGAAAVSRNYSFRSEDLRPPLQVSWTADGIVLSPGAESTAIRFSTAGAQPGHVLTKRVALRVSDADNLVAQASVTIEIHITPESDGLPPVCRVKPWLPQCQQP